MPTPKKQVEERPIEWNELTQKECVGENAMTVDQAKDLLEWKEEPQAGVWGDEYLLEDYNKTHIRCERNSTNRPFTESWAKTLAQEILNKRFAPNGPNGENIIISKTGLVLSGQHRLIGLVLAGQMWAGKDKAHWQEIWPTEPTMQTLLVYGIDESPETLRTLDNVRPRSLSDVLFTGEEFREKKYTTKDRRTLTKMTDYAVRLLWHRAGADQDAFAPRRTHSEALDFIQRHPKILKAVKHVYEENGDNYFGTGTKSIVKIGPGYVAGLLYLMGASASDVDHYLKKGQDADPPSEKRIDFSNWKKAEEFWVEMAASGRGTLKVVRQALGDLANKVGNENSGGSLQEKFGIVCKAWQHFVQNHKITEEDLVLDYTINEDGERILLTEGLTVGGIDLGEPADDDEADTAATEEGPVPPVRKPSKKAQEAAAKARSTQPTQRVPGEAKPVENVEYDSDHKPPAPKLLSTPLNKRPEPKPASTTPQAAPKPKPRKAEPVSPGRAAVANGEQTNGEPKPKAAKARGKKAAAAEAK